MEPEILLQVEEPCQSAGTILVEDCGDEIGDVVTFERFGGLEV